MDQNKINIAILLGDPSGIGPELVSKLLSENITNKTALITGGARRIGAHISEYLHGKGMNILIHYRQSENEAKKLKVKLML